MLSHPAVASHKLMEVSPSCHTVTMLCLGTGDARLHDLVGREGICTFTAEAAVLQTVGLTHAQPTH
jgi:hypothetical protein